MIIKQFYDAELAQASYALFSNNEIVIIDPARNPEQYYEFADTHQGVITAVIETHPHADFVSSHLQIHQDTNATIYTSRFTGALYPHKTFDSGDYLRIGNITLQAFNTPGHSPDSICILVIDALGESRAIFTGDTLFAGGVGRPDLREKTGKLKANRVEAACQLYKSTREVLMTLPETVDVFPAHGAGSLCGKHICEESVTTIGKELAENPYLQPMPEEEFVDMVLEDQLYAPKYFPATVELNRRGATSYEEAIAAVPQVRKAIMLHSRPAIVDARPAESFRKRHAKGAINIPTDRTFASWLGTIIAPDEAFYLVAENHNMLKNVIRMAAKIGYEHNIVAAFENYEFLERSLLVSAMPVAHSPSIHINTLLINTSAYTIVDVRSKEEVRKDGTVFYNAIHIPLPELEQKACLIDTDKPVVVHCSHGYRSAIAASILQTLLAETTIYDLGKSISSLNMQLS
jgi:hydroxyacylglutathione hydrolase